MSELRYRLATEKDLPQIIELIADDQLGKTRETYHLPLPQSYVHAFEQIDKDPNQELTVCELDGEIVGTFQLTYIQYLTYQGRMRALVEAVRVKNNHRGKGLGRKMFEYIFNRARGKGAHMVQLTSNKKRTESIRFYESLGFEASHEGFKLHF